MLEDNEALHPPPENAVARRRCRQLIEGGYGLVDWSSVLGEK